jgi:hypothetical protein
MTNGLLLFASRSARVIARAVVPVPQVQPNDRRDGGKAVGAQHIVGQGSGKDGGERGGQSGRFRMLCLSRGLRRYQVMRQFYIASDLRLPRAGCGTARKLRRALEQGPGKP